MSSFFREVPQTSGAAGSGGRSGMEEGRPGRSRRYRPSGTAAPAVRRCWRRCAALRLRSTGAPLIVAPAHPRNRRRPAPARSCRRRGSHRCGMLRCLTCSVTKPEELVAMRSGRRPAQRWRHCTDRRFERVCRNEVLVTLVVEVSHTGAAIASTASIFCCREVLAVATAVVASTMLLLVVTPMKLIYISAARHGPWFGRCSWC